MNIEERVKNTEIQQALLAHRLEDHFSAEDDFQERVIKDLDYLKTRDIKVFQFIETRMKKEEAGLKLRQEIVSKLVTSGIWAAVVFIAVILWNAFITYIQKGGQ